jgi:hypothetical protein
MLVSIGIINFVMWFAAVIFFFYVRRIPFYHPVSFYLFYHLLGFVLRPFVAAHPEANTVWNYIGFDVKKDHLIFSTIATNLGLLALSVGAILSKNGRDIESKIKLREFFIHRKIIFALACCFVTALSLYTSRASTSSFDLDAPPAYELEADETGGQALIEVSGYKTAMEHFIVGLLVMLFLLFDMNFLTLAIFLPWILVRMWIGTGRWNFLLPLIFAGTINTWWGNRNWPSKKFLIVGLIFLLAFNILGGNREAFRMLMAGEYTWKNLVEDHQETRGVDFGLSDFQEFELTTFLYAVVPEQTGWNYGSQYLRLLVWPIPRQLWPDKPVFTSFVNLGDIGNVFGLSFSILGDFYSILGLPSLVICMGLLGYFLQSFYTSVVSTSNLYLFTAYWVFLMECPQWFRDGGVTIIFFFSVIYLPIALCLWLGKTSIKVIPASP